MRRRVPAELGQVVIDLDSDLQQVWVVERDGPRQLSLLIGLTEALALQRALEKIFPDRPLTHELLEATIRGLGGRVVRVEITELREAIFHARLVLEDARGKEVALEARPSDAIPIAVRAGVPLYVEDGVFAAAAACEPG